MAPEEEPRHEGFGRRPTRKRKSRRVSLDIPERFRYGDDVHDDVTAPKRKDAVSMNQSLFSMITRAGQQSQAELRALREAESGDSDDERPKRAPSAGAIDGTVRLSRFSQLRDADEDQGRHSGSHLQAPSEHSLLRSLPRLKIFAKKGTKPDAPSPDRVMSSQILHASPSPDRAPTPPSDRPSIRAAAREHALTAGSHAPERRRLSDTSPERSLSNASASLAQRLQQIFEFESVEDVISDYTCWLLQSILVQGDLYITQKHICFYAYLPKKYHDGKKTGYLAKRGRTKYNRYWFELQGDVLAYFTDATEKYYPRHRINLRHAILAELVEPKEKAKEETVFIVKTDERSYQFKADSAASAKEWVRSIQKVIFRTHNEGNSVKISLPIANVLEIEESPVLDFNHTFKIRVIDNDETFAIDEYFFSFHSRGEDALDVLRIMISDNYLHQLDESQADEGSRRPSTATHPAQAASLAPGHTTPAQITERVRATLSPLSGDHVARTRLSAESARSSMDVHQSASHERSRSADFTRNLHHSRPESHPSSNEDRDSEGFEKSGYSHPTKSPDSSEGSPAIQSVDESTVSASQILGGSDVFRSPDAYSRAAAVTVPRKSHDRDPVSPTPDTNISGPTPSQIPHRDRSLDNQPHVPMFVTGNDTHNSQTNIALSASTSTLQNLASYPLQKATGLAGFLRTRSKRVGGLLASESKGYYAKVSGMLAGGRKHYAMGDGSEVDEHPHRYEDNEDAAKATEHFREHFGFSESEELQSSYFASLQRVLPNYGKIYISKNHFCFRSLMPTSKLKVILPMRDIETANKENGFRLGYHGLAVVIRGHEELFFEFSKAGFRDECAISILRPLEAARIAETGDLSSSDDDSSAEAAKAEHQLLKDARREKVAEETSDIADIIRADHDRIPLIFDDPLASIVDFKPSESLNIVCLTIGSRGDVQPYIALCKELLKEGHRPRIATHDEFEPWVRKHGIDFARVDGNPAELMRICVEHGMFTFSFLREANAKFRGWLDGVCGSAWKACQGADVLIESPSAMVGIHIAEALEIPYFRAFTMPWTRTRAYPHAFSVLEKKMGGSYNAITYTAFDTLFWTAIAGQINNWRRRDLGLASTSQSKMQANARPFMYNFSPSVVPPPLDWPDWISVTGYWFLDESDNYQPPEDLLEFIAKARKDNKKLVYVGFGSVVIEDPAALTRTVVESVLKAEVRCVLSKGWSDRLENKDASKVEVPLPPEIFQIQAAPHDWLFKQMDAVVHHGGSGTTGASLRAGVPTIIHPFFGDQFFYASRVEDLGVGIWLKLVNTSLFGLALWRVCNDNRIIVKARTIGQKIRKENGTRVAVQTLYRELDRARTQIPKHTKHDNNDTDEFDEDWTMIEEEENMDIPRAFALQEPLMGTQQASTDTPETGKASLAVAGVVLQGASASKEGASRQG